MGVLIEWHYRTDTRPKILLLFKLFVFIDKFQLAILTGHHFASIMISQQNLFISFRNAG